MLLTKENEEILAKQKVRLYNILEIFSFLLLITYLPHILVCSVAGYNEGTLLYRWCIYPRFNP